MLSPPFRLVVFPTGSITEQTRPHPQDEGPTMILLLVWVTWGAGGRGLARRLSLPTTGRVRPVFWSEKKTGRGYGQVCLQCNPFWG